MLEYTINNGCKWNRYVCDYAAVHNHLYIIEWVHERDPEYNYEIVE